jgi:hypothetical protein
MRLHSLICAAVVAVAALPSAAMPACPREPEAASAVRIDVYGIVLDDEGEEAALLSAVRAVPAVTEGSGITRATAVPDGDGAAGPARDTRSGPDDGR